MNNKPEYMRQWRQNNPARVTEYKRREKARQDMVRSALSTIKLEQGCTDCGYKDQLAPLQFDHVRGEKMFMLAATSGLGVSIERALVEVDKCDVVCANCHAIRTEESLFGKMKAVLNDGD